jgi:hypothetical protein
MAPDELRLIVERRVGGHSLVTKGGQGRLPDSDDGFIAKASLDGQAQPAQDQKVIWVAPSDGYKVAP